MPETFSGKAVSRLSISSAALAAVAFASLAGHASPQAQATASASVQVIRHEDMFADTWPGDFNRDGYTDLVSSADGPPERTSRSFVQVALGRGDGTFAPPIVSAHAGRVLTVSDINRDGRLDVVVKDNANLVVLPGLGTGAFAAARPIGAATGFEFDQAFSADFDGDGHRDILHLQEPELTFLYPGNGDFTFDEPISIATQPFPHGGVVSDLNRDGRPDFVIANRYAASVSVFLNQGAFNFNATDLPVGHAATDATAADVNRDGRLDLLVSTTVSDDPNPGYFEGHVQVLLGDGRGGFGLPTEYATLPGAVQIVAGDFTRDGIVDVATGNWSSLTHDDLCGSVWRTWDSVSILAGRLDGTFADAISFSVGDQRQVQSDSHQNSVRSLLTNDVNADGSTDLIVSDGVLFLTRPPAANRQPTVSLGTDAVLLSDGDVLFKAAASDPDEHVLMYSWTVSNGLRFAPIPDPCHLTIQPGEYTYTVTVDDGHGGTATDSVTYTVVAPNHSGLGQFPRTEDIGAVGAAGAMTFDPTSGTYTINASGADIWGTQDEFHFAWEPAAVGDFQITALVHSIGNTYPWAKAGVMIRENLAPDSRHASLFVTPGRGVSFQRRAVAGGVSVLTAGPGVGAPVWVKLAKVGDVVSAYTRVRRTDPWVLVGRETLAGFTTRPIVGLAATSHADGTLTTARFSEVTSTGTPPWTGTAIGTGTGSATSDGVVFTVNGRGTDIWNTADAFYFVYTPLPGNVVLTARVRSLTNTYPWAKAGVMFRQSLAAGSVHAMTVVTPGRGVSFQYRSASDGASVIGGSAVGAAPGWVRLSRRDATFTSAWSSDGIAWTTLGTVSIPMSGLVYLGLPMTSHDAAATGTAVFDDVTIAYQ